MSKNTWIYVAGFAIIAIMCLGTLAYGMANGMDFGGADDGAEGVVEEVDPEYKPWTNGLGIELPSETESLLFAVQAAIGAILIGYFIGRNVAKKQ